MAIYMQQRVKLYGSIFFSSSYTIICWCKNIQHIQSRCSGEPNNLGVFHLLLLSATKMQVISSSSGLLDATLVSATIRCNAFDKCNKLWDIVSLLSVKICCNALLTALNKICCNVPPDASNVLQQGQCLVSDCVTYCKAGALFVVIRGSLACLGNRQHIHQKMYHLTDY